jgi:hypothetical protein
MTNPVNVYGQRTSGAAPAGPVPLSVVTLTGTMRLEPGRDDLVPLAVRLVWDIDGVVDVVNRLAETKAEHQVSTA